MTELPLEAATRDVIARYERGNNLLASAAVALRRLRERVEAGEANGVDWDDYRHTHLEPHMSRRWIEQQLRLAPPKATEAEVASNVDQYRAQNRERVQAHRQRQRAETQSALRNALFERECSNEPSSKLRQAGAPPYPAEYSAEVMEWLETYNQWPRATKRRAREAFFATINRVSPPQSACSRSCPPEPDTLTGTADREP